MSPSKPLAGTRLLRKHADDERQRGLNEAYQKYMDDPRRWPLTNPLRGEAREAWMANRKKVFAKYHAALRLLESSSR